MDIGGAGDVFHGACALGELRGWPLEWTLAFANAAASPRLPEVVEFLKIHGRRDIARALM